MADPLFVLMGAGASLDSTSRHEYLARPERRPPLVTELFDLRFDTILREYPLAQMAAADIRQANAMEEPPALEEFIAERYRASEHPDDRRKWLSLPYYLQQALYEVSGYSHHPDNFDLLITQLRRVRDVVVVTLNYDTLFEQRLQHIRGRAYRALDHYLGRDTGVALIKLHGSVNWAMPIITPFGSEAFAAPPDDLEFDPSKIEIMPTTEGVQGLRFRSTPPPHYFYPALSVPVGADDLISCPDTHVEYLVERLDAAEALDLLVLGYSAFDKRVVQMLADARKEVRSLFVVSRDGGSAAEAALRLAGPLDFEVRSDEHCFDRPFNDFAQSGALANWFDGLPGQR